MPLDSASVGLRCNIDFSVFTIFVGIAKLFLFIFVISLNFDARFVIDSKSDFGKF